MIATLEIQTAMVLRPMLEPSRYKAIYGGRGALKSHFFSELGIERALKKAIPLVRCLEQVT